MAEQQKQNDKKDEKVEEPPKQIKVRVPDKYKDMRSEAKERRILFKKHKGLIRAEEQLSNFKEPAAILMRRSGAGQWFENVTKGKFDFDHSDGSKRFIIITGKPQDMQYAGKTFKLYILHEDFPLPLPEDPLYTTEQVSLMLEQALISTQKLKAKDWEGKTNLVKTIIWGVIGIIGAYILYKILAPTGNTQPAQQVAQQAVENLSTVVRDATPTVLG